LFNRKCFWKIVRKKKKLEEENSKTKGKGKDMKNLRKIQKLRREQKEETPPPYQQKSFPQQNEKGFLFVFYFIYYNKTPTPTHFF
jgi:hypothetical protein